VCILLIDYFLVHKLKHNSVMKEIILGKKDEIAEIL